MTGAVARPTSRPGRLAQSGPSSPQRSSLRIEHHAVTGELGSRGGGTSIDADVIDEKTLGS